MEASTGIEPVYTDLQELECCCFLYIKRLDKGPFLTEHSVNV
jgi:hypothetical protein